METSCGDLHYPDEAIKNNILSGCFNEAEQKIESLRVEEEEIT